MEIKTTTVEAKGIRFSILENDCEIARAYLYQSENIWQSRIKYEKLLFSTPYQYH